MDPSLHSVSEVLTHYGSSPTGLTAASARKKLRKLGSNELRPNRLKQLVRRVIEPFASLFILVLLAAAAISIVSGHLLDAVVVGVVVIINAVIAWSQSFSSERVLNSLRKLDTRSVTVLRDDEQIEIPATGLVPGDVVVLTEGNTVPADGRVLSENNFEVDESSLTGESLPVTKKIESLAKAGPAYTRTNMVFKGTVVTTGHAEVCITATGNRTELGTIANLAQEDDLKAPVQVKIDQLTRLVVIATAALAVGTLALGVFRGYAVEEMLRFALALTVSAIPEGLPVSLTVIMLLGVRRMASRQALVRRLPAVETLGMVTVIATDKTGTLTLNQLAVADVWTPQGNEDEFIETAALTISSHDKERHEPVITAIADTYKVPRGWTEVGDLPFDDEARISAVLWEHQNKLWAYVLGAPEQIIKRSALTVKAKAEVKVQLQIMATLGYRILAVAAKPIGSLHELQAKELNKLNLVGLIALADKLRPGIKNSIAKARAAGIKTIMVTGDHRVTAAAIAAQAGVSSSAQEVAHGDAIDHLSDVEIRKQLTGKTVLARITPEVKYQVVRALKGHEIIAMTGDGVNDAPALTKADIGIAMGSGTDAAKEAADMVLLNNDFSTIVEAVKQGRTIYANIRKLVFYLLSSNLGEALTTVGALIIGIPLPLTAVQILWVNLITDTAVGIPIGLEPPEEHYMDQPPRDPKAPLLGKVMVERLILMAITIAALTIGVFMYYLPQGYGAAQTMAFYTLVVIQWANALNARSERHISLAGLRRQNHALTFGIAAAIAIQLVVGLTPLKEFFGLGPLSLSSYAVLGAAAVLTLLVCDVHKMMRKRRA